MNRSTGEPLDGIAHLKQSIIDILTTPIGSRVMRREYGSRLFELVDTPMNEGFAVNFYAATAEALAKWEPRFKLGKINISSIREDGKVAFSLYGTSLLTNEEIKLEGIVI